jgi:hypothetical protein
MKAARVLGRRAPLVASLAALLPAGPALAQQSAGALMSEPIGYTAVADAFEEGDVLDVNVQLGFRRSFASASIMREETDESSEDGRSRRHFTEVAEYEHVRNELVFQLDVGIYRDLMVFVRLPVVLGDDRELSAPGDAHCAAGSMLESCRALEEPVDAGVDPRLFDLSRTLASGQRSGLPRVDVGIAWGVINQYRDRHLANWVLLLQSSIDTSEVMRACVGSDCEPGVSTGTALLKFESRWSYRYRYLEPFAGIAHTLQWVTGAEKLYEPAGELAGAVDPDPPSRTDARIGVAIIPWEDRGRFQRFEVDLAASASAISSGRDMSPMFDALGDSDNPHLTEPNYDRLPSVTGPLPVEVPFTGLTNVEAHAELAFDAEVVMQAARYVRFSLGLGLSYLTPHLLTGAAACNTSVDPSGPSDARAGSCAQGIFNPLYRPAIDAPGRRFRLEEYIAVRLLASAIGQF